jgi:glucose dehydrogenase
LKKVTISAFAWPAMRTSPPAFLVLAVLLQFSMINPPASAQPVTTLEQSVTAEPPAETDQGQGEQTGADDKYQPFAPREEISADTIIDFPEDI